jgi:predicted Fe-Mo cluster-binding NifX family protein
MKIGVPLSDNSAVRKERLAISFHHTSLFGVYDVEQNTLEAINLEENGQTVDFVDLLKQYEIKALISPNYTIMVLKLFKLMKIETLKAAGSDITRNIESFKSGELPPYTFADAKEASLEHCGTDDCGSCHVTC